MQFMTAALAGKDAGEFPAAPESPTPAAAHKVDTPDEAPGAEETH
jgi:hypothetical protein